MTVNGLIKPNEDTYLGVYTIYNVETLCTYLSTGKKLSPIITVVLMIIGKGTDFYEKDLPINVRYLGYFIIFLVGR